MTYVVKGDYAQAEKFFDQAAHACPQCVKYRTNLAMAKGMQGKYDESLKLYEQVLPMCESHYNVGVLADARNDRDRARKEFCCAQAEQAREEAAGEKCKHDGARTD